MRLLEIEMTSQARCPNDEAMAMTRCKLTRERVEKLYAQSVEAERVLHAALDSTEVLAKYFDAARCRAIESSARLCSATQAIGGFPSHPDQISVLPPAAGSLTSCIAWATSSLRSSWNVFRG
jgi:hypothetical protein